jgi:hypothetical protein
MADLIKIKIKKRKGEFNTVLVNLDNIVDIERISNRIHFSFDARVDTKERIGEWESVEEAETFFNKLYSDF